MMRKDSMFDLRYELLARLQSETLPMEFAAHQDIDDLQALSSGKLVEATFPPLEFCREGARYAGPATVTRLTTLGRDVATKYVHLRPKAMSAASAAAHHGRDC